MEAALVVVEVPAVVYPMATLPKLCCNTGVRIIAECERSRALIPRVSDFLALGASLHGSGERPVRTPEVGADSQGTA